VQVTCGAMLLLVCANSRHWWLPASEALYPERAAYVVDALAALALGCAWAGLPAWSRAYRLGWSIAAAVLVVASIPYTIDRYQRTVWQVGRPIEPKHPVSFPLVQAEEYAALAWCRDHLDPRTDVVEVPYNAPGSYLPAVSGIACTGWHVHCLLLPKQGEFFQRRPITHRWIQNRVATDAVGLETVFRNDRVAIVRIR